MRERHKIATEPSFAEEQRLAEQGYCFIAGIDEVGRGPLAGPVVAAAVILPPKLDARWLTQVRDSKQLTAERRVFLFPLISEAAIGIGVGLLPPDAIDAHGIVKATRLAMCSAVERLPHPPDFLLIDHLRLPELDIPQKSITKGDSLSFSIACASIVAKVTRDRIMVAQDEVHPKYGFARHKGYATREHLSNLRRWGACPIHRRCFTPVMECNNPLNRRRTGVLGERIAADYLEKQGYRVRERNFRCQEGEIDIIAEKDDFLIFVEVRTRRSSSLVTPEESVTAYKVERLITVAQSYIQRHQDLPPWCRIDVVAVELTPKGKISRIEHIENVTG